MEHPLELAPFEFFTNPRLIFGAGSLDKLPSLISEIGDRVLIVRGKSSLALSPKWKSLTDTFKVNGIKWIEQEVIGEPSVELVDMAVERAKKEQIHLVVSIGGGSVIDTGKAVSAMIPQKDGIANYLEGIGTKKHNGIKTPFIAVPTTAGTGSEASKNAVIGKIGATGFKKSLRHNNLVPDIAILDSELTLTCPFTVSVACGLDALTQLIEAYVSTNATPLTDSLTLSGIQHFARSFDKAVFDEPENIAARDDMLYASYLSGVGLANAGLGVVHGIAGVIGGFFDIPHGVICAILLPEATKYNILKMSRDPDKYATALDKYARVGVMLNGKDTGDRDKNLRALTLHLSALTESGGFPRLGDGGVRVSDVVRIAEKAGVKNNPVALSKAEIEAIIQACV
jgi:alcohol dehydrogenase class IV